MAQNKNLFDPEVVMPKVKSFKNWLTSLVAKRKKLFIGLLILFIVFYGVGYLRSKKTLPKENIKTVSTVVDKSFDFPALNNLGKPINSTKIKIRLTNAEKTNQVVVGDKPYVAKNDKVFLILHLEIKNDTTQIVNVVPGDLIRLSYDGDENKYAPDLHNNLVSVSAISTRLDRVGFVVPGKIKEYKLFIGELEGKKETVTITFPS